MIRSRIAPTPSGYLHIGNALNFVLTYVMVRRAGGNLRLRIDDIDAPRARSEYIEDIFRTLEWMGMDWDEGPYNTDQHLHTFSQSLRAERYDGIIQQLIATRKVYACTCSRKETETCICREKELPLDTPDTALRIITEEQPVIIKDKKKMGDIAISLHTEMKDFVIRRRDGIAAYQVASLADDIDFGINLIVRGEDLVASTAAQLYLASLIGAESFLQTKFYHHLLLKDEHGEKLSKSAGSLSLKAMREVGEKPDQLYLELSRLLGISDPFTSLSEILSSGFNP